MKKTLIIIILIVIALSITFFIPRENKQKGNNNVIVTSFYPIYIMSANIIQGAQNIELENLTQYNIGCLHDYTLSTADVKKIENANIFIQNGLGLESFINKITQTYTNLKFIDSSKEITNIIKDDEHVNPHIWTSIENYIKQVEHISKQLCEYDTNNKEIYAKNTEKYIKSLQELKKEYDTQLEKLKGVKTICLNEALEYLTNDLQMEVVSINTNHEESSLSADTIKDIINKMKQENIQNILIGKEDDKKNAQTLAKETGAKIYELETCLIGEVNNESYIISMKNNLEILKQIEK